MSRATPLDPAQAGQLTIEQIDRAAPPPGRDCVSDELTPAQREAVLRRGHSLLLTATAGSGKTRVLVERFACAVLEDEIAPERILAITFTEKAAQELRARVRERFVELGARDAARDSEAAFVTTIHGFCARLLRTHPLAAGLDPDFEVCDDATARQLRRRAFDRALHAFIAGDTDVRAERALDVVASFGVRRIEAAIDSVHERLRSRGEREPRLPPARPRLIPDVAPERHEGSNGDARTSKELDRSGIEADAVALAPELDALLRALADAYLRLKRARNVLDFDDLELEALALLQADPALRAAWSERFELMMVDEFQDTNPRQVALLELLERDNLFVVGDEFQSIYGFRFAEPELFRRRHDVLEREGATIELVENFRSRPEILTAINVAFERRFGTRFLPLRSAREDAHGGGTPDRGGGAGDPADLDPGVELLVTDCAGWDGADLGPAATGGASSWRRAEARAIAQRIAALVAVGEAAPGETIVLLRAGTNMAIYERALIDGGLRTLAIGGGFWNALEISDLTAYLRALANPLDTIALYTLLASPLVGASADALTLIGQASGQLDPDPYRVLRGALAGEDPHAAAALAELDGADRERLTAFVAAFAGERRQAPRLGLDALLTRVLDTSGYRALLLADPTAQRRLANVQKLLRLARRFEAREGRDLRAFLEHVGTQRIVAPREPEAPIDSEDSDAVRLMTIHAAKGLEADVVCVADLGRLRTSSDKPYVIADGERLGICVPRPDGSFVDALDYAELRNELRDADAEEEDRVLYVAMTRARGRLLLSGAVDVARWPRQSRTSPPLAWLGPALVDDIEGRLGELATRGPGATLELDAQPEGQARLLLALNSAATARSDTGASVAEAEGGVARGAPPRWRPLPVAPPPAVAPPALSYSALSDYAACGYRYYLERVLGLPELATDGAGAPASDGLEARVRGTIVHALLEHVDFAAPASPDEAAVRSAAVREGADPDADQIRLLRELVAAFALSPLAARLAAGADVGREQPFAFALDGGGEGGEGDPLINGYLDVIAREPDGTLLVVDYKTDAVGDADLERLTQQDYGAQRLAYALAGLAAGAQSVEVAHCYLERPEELVSARYGVGDEQRLREQLRSLASGIFAGRFEVAAEPHRQLCAGCPGRVRLCSWELDMTGRELGEGHTVDKSG
jgi:ATP-dependent exoDNAse (exonuclease V) beta subunit